MSSDRNSRNVIVEKDIRIPMRDGTILRGDLYRPVDSLEPGRAAPGVVTRTPYDKELSGAGLVAVMPNALKLAERGYAVVVCDTRGRYASEGEFNPFHQEGPDGYDTLEWVAAQQWCDGKTAIYGPSYVGATTMLAAREAPPSLRCAIPDHHGGRLLRRLDLSGRRVSAGLRGAVGRGTGGDGLSAAGALAPGRGAAGATGGAAGQLVPLPRQSPAG